MSKLLSILLCIFCLSFTLISSHKKTFTEKEINNNSTLVTLKNHAITLKQFCKSSHFDTSVCFLIDMNIPNGKNRFFVYSFKKDSVLLSGLVAHGNSSSLFYQKEVKFSNQLNSYCSSQGRYKIGESYYGRFGLAYKLYGLDTSNSNAYNRFVVLHAHSCVPDKEVYPDFICNSLGCPTVSPNFLKTLQEQYLLKTKQPVCMWIYK
jgi:hypothetical protein